MPESGRRVVLLARPGTARDRVRAALAEVGAELALEADPTQAGVDEIGVAGGEVVIVVLDSATEAALDRLDAVLLDPAIDVMYEEAELAANRSGWDAARWTRHLAAKLHRHANVLPPGRARAEVVEAASASTPEDARGDAGASRATNASGTALPQVAAVDTLDAVATRPDEVAAGPTDRLAVPGLDAKAGIAILETAAFDAPAVDAAADTRPVDAAPVDVEADSATPLAMPGFDGGAGIMLPDAVSADAVPFEFDGLPPLLAATPAHPLSDEFAPGVEPGAYAGFDPVAAEMSEFEFDADQVIAFDPGLREDFSPSTAESTPVPSGIELAFESEIVLPEIASPAAQVDALQFRELSLDDLRSEPALPSAERPQPAFDVPAAEAAAGDASSFAGVSSGHVLALVTDDAPSPAMAPAQPVSRLADLEARISTLSLVDDAGPAAAPAPATATAPALVPAPATGGAVLLVAGLGGPDAVRQVLGALPAGFPRPVLVLQRLDGGRYDRLVTQLQRATSLPVDLADAGGDARPGVVYVLPDGVGLAAGAGGIRFDGGDPFEALPPSDSAVLLLSGADAALADRLAGTAWSKALVAGQSADGCYDATASNALAAHGRPTAEPAELARQLIERWVA